MPANLEESGRVQYGGRAFHQDASDAMRGDIIRGLIEAITNADDGYARMDSPPDPGRIRIEVEHRRTQPWTVRVRDRGPGIDDLHEKIVELGGRTSGFERGEDQRGNFGRGAKDLAAFGPVTFTTVYDGLFQSLVLRPDGSWEMLARRKARESDKADLGLRDTGTVVEIQARENIRCPRHDTLKRRLSTHYQLRDIMSASDRRVELVNLNDGSTDLLVYQPPSSSEVLAEQVDIEGYPDATATLRIHRLDVHGSEGPEDAGRAHGLLVKGRRAIYDNTLFSFEGNPHAGWFTGEARCEYIDVLAKEYDDLFERGEDLPPENPVPLLSRRRDGFNRAHPFYEALREAIEEPLGQLVAAEAERARREAGKIENKATRQALDRLAREAGRLINDELRDIEAEELPDISQEGLPPLLSIIPEQGFAYMGEDRTLTCAARADGLEPGDVVQFEVDPSGVVELLESEAELRAHRRREDVLVAQVRLRPLISGEATLVTGRLDNRVAHALVEVRPEREEIEIEVTPPETLEFSRASYCVGLQRGKNLTLEAPASIVAEHGDKVFVSSSDPGVVVRTPQVELTFDDEIDYYTANVRVEARQLGATAEVKAQLEDVVAIAHVAVARKEEGPGVRFRLVDEHFGPFRAMSESELNEMGEEITVIKIAGRHPALRPLLGPNSENQDLPVCRGVIAEIAADWASRHVVEELFRVRRSLEEFDSARFYREHYRRMTKFLPRFQKLLVGGTSSGPAQVVEISES